MPDKQTIRDFLTTLSRKNTPVGDDDSLIASKLLDSLNVAELIVFLEDTFHVALDNDDLTPDNLDSIHAIMRLVEKNRAG